MAMYHCSQVVVETIWLVSPLLNSHVRADAAGFYVICSWHRGGVRLLVINGTEVQAHPNLLCDPLTFASTAIRHMYLFCNQALQKWK